MTKCENEQLQLDKTCVQDLEEFFKMFGDSTRIRIIYTLLHKELCVNELADLLDMGQSRVSHQLRLLKSGRLVKYRKEGKQVYYSLDDDHVRGIVNMGLEHVLEG